MLSSGSSKANSVREMANDRPIRKYFVAYLCENKIPRGIDLENKAKVSSLRISGLSN